MPILESEFAALRDPRLAVRLADYATSASPAWLWSTDGARILWANAVGAAIFGAPDTAACAQRRFDPKDPIAAQIARIAPSLPASEQARLERLRGFGAGFGRLLTCACSRAAADNIPAVLILATEPAGLSLTLQERVRRLFADSAQPLAAFAPEGALLYGTEAALAQFEGATTLSELGIEASGAEALGAGTAQSGPVAIERLGRDASAVLVVTWASPANETAAGATRSEEGDDTQAAAAAPPIEVSAAEPEAAAAPAATAETPPSKPALHDEPLPERRHPLRFVWQMDADGRFVVGSDEFLELLGPRTTAAFGRLWNEIAAELKLDVDNQVARAIATHETWSGIVVLWPVDNSSERLPVELSGLPVFDRGRDFRGYRGFGVCRDIDRINRLTRARREHPIGHPDQADVAPALDGPPVAAEPGPAVAAEPALAAVASAELATRPESQAEPSASVAAAAEPEAASAAVSPAPPVATSAANVVPFRAATPSDAKAPSLSPVERNAFRELAQELTARLRGTREDRAAESNEDGAPTEGPTTATETSEAPEPSPAFLSGDVTSVVLAPAEGAASTAAAAAPAPAHEAAQNPKEADRPAPQSLPAFEPTLLDRIPLGVLVYRDDSLLYANRQILADSGYDSLEALVAAGGLKTLFADPGPAALVESGGAQPLWITTRGGDRLPAGGRLLAVSWEGAPVLALVLTDGRAEQRYQAAARALGTAENEIRDLNAMVDAAAGGAVVLDRSGTVMAATRGAETLFGCAASDLAGRPVGELFAAESERIVREHFERFARGEQRLHDAFELAAPAREGEVVPLLMTLTRLEGGRFCAVLRDAAPLHKIEDELRAARREAQKMADEKAAFLAKVSHEIRTPLNAITGFAEVIMAERLGPISNERYREYVKDIHVAGTHLGSLLNDLLDLSKAESGKLELAFANVSLNELTQQCVGLMQPQASRARIIIRTSLTPGLPQVIADERSLRQIVLNLLSNSISFTGPGGQVIVSTAFADSGETILRVRDTGVGMSEKDIEAALEPFRQSATTASWGSGGPSLGLPLTKALAEANRAHFSIKSAPNAGTLVEVAFPAARVVAR